MNYDTSYALMLFNDFFEIMITLNYNSTCTLMPLVVYEAVN